MNEVAIVRKIRCFYYPEERVFKTEDGSVILNLYPLVPPNMIFLFRHHKKTMTYTNYKYNIQVTLLYPLKEAV